MADHPHGVDQTSQPTVDACESSSPIPAITVNRTNVPLPADLKKAIRLFRHPLKSTRTMKVSALYGVPVTPRQGSIADEVFLQKATQELLVIKNICTSQKVKLTRVDRKTLMDRASHLRHIIQQTRGELSIPRQRYQKQLVTERYPTPCRASTEMICTTIRRWVNNSVKGRLEVLPEVPESLPWDHIFPTIGFPNATNFINHLENRFPHEGIGWENWGILWMWGRKRTRPEDVVFYNTMESPEFKQCWNPGRIVVRLLTGQRKRKPVLFTHMITRVLPDEPPTPQEAQRLNDTIKRYAGSEHDPLPGPLPAGADHPIDYPADSLADLLPPE